MKTVCQQARPLEREAGDEAYAVTSRDKRIGSLSIVNSVDVLRQRVLLELARRKAMEDQRQISENRRILDSVGKRAEHAPARDYQRRSSYDDEDEEDGGGDDGDGALLQ